MIFTISGTTYRLNDRGNFQAVSRTGSGRISSIAERTPAEVFRTLQSRKDFGGPEVTNALKNFFTSSGALKNVPTYAKDNEGNLKTSEAAGVTAQLNNQKKLESVSLPAPKPKPAPQPVQDNREFITAREANNIADNMFAPQVMVPNPNFTGTPSNTGMLNPNSALTGNDQASIDFRNSLLAANGLESVQDPNTGQFVTQPIEPEEDIVEEIEAYKDPIPVGRVFLGGGAANEAYVYKGDGVFTRTIKGRAGRKDRVTTHSFDEVKAAVNSVVTRHPKADVSGRIKPKEESLKILNSYTPQYDESGARLGTIRTSIGGGKFRPDTRTVYNSREAAQAAADAFIQANPNKKISNGIKEFNGEFYFNTKDRGNFLERTFESTVDTIGNIGQSGIDQLERLGRSVDDEILQPIKDEVESAGRSFDEEVLQPAIVTPIKQAEREISRFNENVIEPVINNDEFQQVAGAIAGGLLGGPAGAFAGAGAVKGFQDEGNLRGAIQGGLTGGGLGGLANLLFGGGAGGFGAGGAGGMISGGPGFTPVQSNIELNPYQINPIVLGSAYNMLGKV